MSKHSRDMDGTILTLLRCGLETNANKHLGKVMYELAPTAKKRKRG